MYVKVGKKKDLYLSLVCLGDFVLPSHKKKKRVFNKPILKLNNSNEFDFFSFFYFLYCLLSF